MHKHIFTYQNRVRCQETLSRKMTKLELETYNVQDMIEHYQNPPF